MVSPPLPPVAGISFVTATEFLSELYAPICAKVKFDKSSSYSIPVILVSCPASIFDETPPPTKYFTVIVVFDGDVPYVFVFKKFVGSNDSSLRF